MSVCRSTFVLGPPSAYPFLSVYSLHHRLSVNLSGRSLDGKSSQKDSSGSKRQKSRENRKSFEKRAPHLDFTGLACIEVFQDRQCHG